MQQQNVARHLSQGRRVVGRKIGLTSATVQAQLGVNRPDFGVLLDDMDVSNTATIAMDMLLQPKIEAEIAFTLEADLDAGDLSREQVLAAVAHAAAALEIVDSRIADWDITFGDTVADNASSGLFLTAADGVSMEHLDPVTELMTLTRNGEVVSTGAGSACLGDPINALVWLARTARDIGDPLRAGQVVLSGALGPMVEVRPADRFEVRFSTLGSLTAQFGAALDDRAAN